MNKKDCSSKLKVGTRPTVVRKKGGLKMTKVISTKVEEKTDKVLEAMAAELDVSKSWIINQALKQYIGRYDDHLSDVRIASIGQTISHEDIRKEYGIQNRLGRKSV